jgi:hypothetical protein
MQTRPLPKRHDPPNVWTVSIRSVKIQMALRNTASLWQSMSPQRTGMTPSFRFCVSRYRRLNTIFERSKEHLIAFVAIAFISILSRCLRRLVVEEISA